MCRTECQKNASCFGSHLFLQSGDIGSIILWNIGSFPTQLEGSGLEAVG